MKNFLDESILMDIYPTRFYSQIQEKNDHSS